MEWIQGIGNAISFIEENLCEELSVGDIAKKAYLSPYYFQKGFAMLCGFTVAEYVRQRRLSLAGSELLSSDGRVIDIAMKYGYDSPDSFARAFTRFHGATPTAVRKEGAMMKHFAPLKIKIILEGGCMMDYRITKKEAFTVMGVSKAFRYDTAFEEIPRFWTEHYETGKGQAVCGMYGICIDRAGEDAFEYLIADNYKPWMETPDGFVTRTIPGHTWAVFQCKGALPGSLQDVNRKIFTEWLPNCKDYEIADGFNVEMYSNPQDYPQGNQDEAYCSEIWIPVKKKQADPA